VETAERDLQKHEIPYLCLLNRGAWWREAWVKKMRWGKRNRKFSPQEAIRSARSQADQSRARGDGCWKKKREKGKERAFRWNAWGEFRNAGVYRNSEKKEGGKGKKATAPAFSGTQTPRVGLRKWTQGGTGTGETGGVSPFKTEKKEQGRGGKAKYH